MRLAPLPALSDNYIWLLADDDGHALIVDPGEAAPVQEVLERENLKLEAILLTHHHPDHIGGVAELARAHDPVVYAPHDERISHVQHRVGEGEMVDIESPRASFRVLEIPGHTRSHVAYYGTDLLFCGDMLFSLGCGRMFEGSPAQMLDSLERLLDLPDETQVCCGHEYTRTNAAFALGVDPDNDALKQRAEKVEQLRAAGQPTLPSLLGRERACNPFLRVDDPAIIAWARQHGAEHGAEDERVARFAALRNAKDHFQA